MKIVKTLFQLDRSQRSSSSFFRNRSVMKGFTLGDTYMATSFGLDITEGLPPSEDVSSHSHWCAASGVVVDKYVGEETLTA